MDVQKKFLLIYEQMAEQLRGRIIGGEFAYGMQLPPEPELARDLSSSRETVRKAFKILEGQSLISKRKGKGTFVVYRKDAPAFTETWRVGIVSCYQRLDGNLDESYSATLFHSLFEGFSGCNVEFINLDYQRSVLEVYQERRLDGLLLINPPKQVAESLGWLAKGNIPHVIISASYGSFREKGLVFIDTDNFGGAKRATEYLIKLGHRRIAYLSGKLDSCNAEDRLKGHVAALAENSIARDDRYFYNTGEERDVKAPPAFISQLLDGGNPPTAVFSGGPGLTMDLLDVFKGRGVLIPEDMSLVGFDDPAFCRHMTPALTVVRQPVAKLGAEACRMLAAQLRNGGSPQPSIILETELIVRESCKPL